jgi:hypothetical protein
LKESRRKPADTVAGRLIVTIGHDSEVAVGESLVIQATITADDSLSVVADVLTSVRKAE